MPKYGFKYGKRAAGGRRKKVASEVVRGAGGRARSVRSAKTGKVAVNYDVNQLVLYNETPKSRNQYQVLKTEFLHTSFTGTGFLVGAVALQTIASMPDIADFVNVFDEYKINKITWTFTLKLVTTSTSLEDHTMPKMLVRYNYDSNLTSASATFPIMQELNDVLGYQFTPQKTQIKYTFSPRTVTPVYLSLVATGYKTNPATWISTQYTGVPHYGIQIAVDYLASGLIIEVDQEWDVSFRDAK